MIDTHKGEVLNRSKSHVLASDVPVFNAKLLANTIERNNAKYRTGKRGVGDYSKYANRMESDRQEFYTFITMVSSVILVGILAVIIK